LNDQIIIGIGMNCQALNNFVLQLMLILIAANIFKLNWNRNEPRY
jgi:hypothetical protein